MIPVVLIAAGAVLGLLALVFGKPAVRLPHSEKTVSIYWIPPLLGVLLLLLTRLITPVEVLSGLTASSEVNPLKILLLFLSMTFLSVYLDEAKFFGYLASVILRRSGENQKVFFCSLFFTVSLLTVFTSNDVIVLTFTPFLCYFARKANVDPVPYLVCEFVAANTWSMALMIGNPTNIYLASSAGVSFGGYLRVMLLPTLLSGLTVFLLLLLLFRKKLASPMVHETAAAEIPDRGLLLIGLVHLALCILCLAGSAYLPLPMYLISFGFALSLVLCTLLYAAVRRKPPLILLSSFHRLPLDIIPFVLSMFVLVLSLDRYGVTGQIRALLAGEGTVFRYGIASFLVSNLVNNIPMSVLFSPIVSGIGGEGQIAALFASVVGSNLGAFFTPVGALAGIMWSEMLKNFGVKYSFSDFLKSGILLAPIPLFVALFTLSALL